MEQNPKIGRIFTHFSFSSQNHSLDERWRWSFAKIPSDNDTITSTVSLATFIQLIFVYFPFHFFTSRKKNFLMTLAYSKATEEANKDESIEIRARNFFSAFLHTIIIIIIIGFHKRPIYWMRRRKKNTTRKEGKAGALSFASHFTLMWRRKAQRTESSKMEFYWRMSGWRSSR